MTLPDGHRSQNVDAPSLPSTVRMRPMGHTVQAVDPAESAYDPAGQPVQEDARVVENVPRGHFAHSPRLSIRVAASEYFPAAHQRQMPKLRA